MFYIESYMENISGSYLSYCKNLKKYILFKIKIFINKFEIYLNYKDMSHLVKDLNYQDMRYIMFFVVQNTLYILYGKENI